MDTDYKEIELYETKLRVYRDGTIWRLCKYTNQFGRKGEWIKTSGKINKDGYCRIRFSNCRALLEHRIVAYAYLGLDIKDTQDIDHINRIRNDNRVDNLRILPRNKNSFNTNAKGYTQKGDRFEAQICVDGRRIYLGSYKTAEEASARYHQEKEILHII